MKAEDTVIQFDETKLTPYSQGFLKGALRDQAEISFKAGEQESDRKWRPILKGSVAMARLAGIKEVVEFVTGYLNPQFWSKDTNEPYYTIKMSVWRAKLKEWEVNDEPKT